MTSHTAPWRILWALASLLFGNLGGQAADPQPTPISSTNIHNLFQVTPRLLSGSQPEDDAAFAELARMGVKTIVSVDGSKPDVETARRHGIRYVHLPIGYDGVPTNRVPELAQAAQLPGPIFVHCHHGLHRGPAAVAVMCLAVENWTPVGAESWLKQAGTSTNYPGLYRAVREFREPGAGAVAAVASLPEMAQTSTVVDTMVAIDAHFDRLKESRTAGWKALPQHPDLTPSHEVTLLWEQFRELARHSDTMGRPADYGEQLARAEQAAEALSTALKAAAGQSDSAAETAFQNLTKTCSACHKRYRN